MVTTVGSRIADRKCNNNSNTRIRNNKNHRDTLNIRLFVLFCLANLSILVLILTRDDDCAIKYQWTINDEVGTNNRFKSNIDHDPIISLEKLLPYKKLMSKANNNGAAKHDNSTMHDPIERESIISHNKEQSNNNSTAVPFCMKDPSAILAMARTIGINPVYINMYKKAKSFAKKYHRSKVKEITLHYDGRQPRKIRGVIIGPTAGPNFKRYGLVALKNGRRVRNIIQGTNLTNKIRLAWMASPDHILQIMNACGPSNNGNKIDVKEPQWKEACVLWKNNTIFDDIIPTEPFPYPNKSANNTQLEAWYKYYSLKAVQLAPYIDNLFLDSDAYPCPGFEKLFDLVDPKEAQPKLSSTFFGKAWQQPSTKAGDFVIGLEQYSRSIEVQKLPVPGDPLVIQDYMTDFPNRNSGVFIMSYRKPMGLAFVQFVTLVTEYIYDTLKIELQRDQPIWRLALYLFKRFDPDFVEHLIPMHASCRTYNAHEGAGVNGFINGMYPKQADGTHCNECHCTPCLINHNAGLHPVNLMGQQGWEDNFVWKNDNNMYKVYT